ncbi:MAG: FtsX-like permease family protein [Verrucomicrobiales bacterium]|nr:FtsX-like permease family protein [Verrucomicrobiales bacterium]
MFVLRLVLKEILHRKLNFLLSVLAIAATVALFVAYLTLSEGSRRETVRVTRDIGFNLRIIPRETDMDQFWSAGYSDKTMPETTLRRLASYTNVFFSYNHLVASLQQRFNLEGKEVILTGLAPTITAPGQAKQPMGYSIPSNSVFLGFEVAQRLGLKKGGSLRLDRREFKVEQALAESGTDDDVRVFAPLREVQTLLKAEGQINEIKAIDCLCLTADQDPLKILRQELEKALPEAKVIQLRTIADARAKQRQLMEKYLAFITPLVLIASALWVCVLAILNVRERRTEIGILRALGHGSGSILMLFGLRSAVLGGVGALTGYALGSVMAHTVGPTMFKVTAASLRIEPALFWQALLAAPALAIVASIIPMVLAITQDPAVTLTEE